MVGVVIVVSAFYILNSIIGFEFMAENVSALDIAMIHTLFNIFSTIILIPFCSLFEKLAIKSVKSKAEDKERDTFAALDDRFLDVTSFAIEKCKELVCEMMGISLNVFKKATGLLDNFDAAEYKKVEELENSIDKYEDKISTYLVKIAATQMSARESKTVTELLHFVGDIERISDHALNVAQAAKEMYDKEVVFSEKAKEDITVMTGAVHEILDLCAHLLETEDFETAKLVEPLEQVIDRHKRKIKMGHIERLREGECTMEFGFILMDIINNYERVADHCSNIAVCFIEIAHDSFETHEYLNQLKSGDGYEFKGMYETFKKKYYIK